TPVLVRSLIVMLSAPPAALTWIFSTPLRSMVTPPMSRVRRTRPPLAEMSMFSPMLAPLKTSRSVPAPPSTTSLPSPGFQMNVSFAVAKQGRVVAAAAGDGVAAIAAEQDIGALAPDDGVVAGAAIEGQCHIVGRQRRRRERIVAGASGDDERVDRLRPGDGDDLWQAGDGQSAVLALYLDHVVALGAGDGHGVRREVAGAAAGHRCQVDRDLRHSGAGQITDHDVVGTAFGVELDLLDAVEIHGHDTDVAGEAH